MGHRRKPVTKDLIRKYFGKQVCIKSRWFAGGYEVITPFGDEFHISDQEVKVLIGGDETYRALTLLAQEVWSGLAVYGSHEEIMIWAAHGTMLGVPVRPVIKRGWFWPTVLTSGIIAGAAHASLPIILICAFLLWMRNRSIKQQERQLAAEIAYRFPRVHGDARAASDGDLQHEGWL